MQEAKTIRDAQIIAMEVKFPESQRVSTIERGIEEYVTRARATFARNGTR